MGDWRLRLDIWLDCHWRGLHVWRPNIRGELACRYCAKPCDL